ncbi:hypothetical protein [uncultured Fibrobacter sp.]|uniref:hypothetical protein n=1 Tax=uncultured Fibrobacter sp. TaxID=261512 RepID=UPI002635F0A8|nr:hypothetical protein [uncultured Fibrobacter sp.]
MAMIDVEKEKKNYEQLMESLNLQEKKEVLRLNNGISQDSWNFGVPIGNFECSNKSE